MKSSMPRIFSALLLLCLLVFTQAATHTQNRRRVDSTSTERSLVSDIEAQHFGKRQGVTANVCANVNLRVDIRVSATLTVVSSPRGSVFSSPSH